MVDREEQIDALTSTFGIGRVEAENMIDESQDRREERIAFLLEDIESDERMSGVPRYRHRYDKAHRDLADEIIRLRRRAENGRRNAGGNTGEGTQRVDSERVREMVDQRPELDRLKDSVIYHYNDARRFQTEAERLSNGLTTMIEAWWKAPGELGNAAFMLANLRDGREHPNLHDPDAETAPPRER